MGLVADPINVLIFLSKFKLFLFYFVWAVFLDI